MNERTKREGEGKGTEQKWGNEEARQGFKEEGVKKQSRAQY